MVAARAPVIDLTLLDPSNPRSVAFQFDQIEGHLAAMPHMRPDGRLGLPRQISMATAAKLRTADATRSTMTLILSDRDRPDAPLGGDLQHLSRAQRAGRGPRGPAVMIDDVCAPAGAWRFPRVIAGSSRPLRKSTNGVLRNEIAGVQKPAVAICVALQRITSSATTPRARASLPTLSSSFLPSCLSLPLPSCSHADVAWHRVVR